MNRNTQFFRTAFAILPIAVLAACTNDPNSEDGVSNATSLEPTANDAATDLANSIGAPQTHLYAAAPQNICGTANESASVALACPSGQTITAVGFASYGTPSGS